MTAVSVPAGEAPLGSLIAPEPDERPDLWPSTARRGDDGSLRIGGRCLTEILAEAPTPVFVLDEADLRGRAATWSAAMAEEFWPDYGMNGGEAFYAGKAFLSTRVARTVLEQGMGIDTASRIELAVGLAGLVAVDGERAASRAARLGLHGNGKTLDEIRTALSHRVGHLVLDSLDEVALATRAVRQLREAGVYAHGETGVVMLRLTTGVHAGGHEFISTGHEDQKFGVSVVSGQAARAIEAVHAAPELRLAGLHSHIGSQIFDLAGFREAVGIVLRMRHAHPDAAGALCEEVDLGGGYGIAYTGADPVPHVSVEPGRSVVGPTTVTLYTVTGLKRVELGDGAGRLYVSVDGGMSDNIRPALYGAAYTALIAGRRSDPAAGLVRARVVGKHCESGDVVVRDVDLPGDLAVGDVLAVPATGAYGRSMASSYNLFTRPGVAWVADGEQGWVLRPQTTEDLFRLEGE